MMSDGLTKYGVANSAQFMVHSTTTVQKPQEQIDPEQIQLQISLRHNARYMMHRMFPRNQEFTKLDASSDLLPTSHLISKTLTDMYRTHHRSVN